ncbi:hypothetical protein V8E55_007547 [Tylopilus felleus]
MPSTQQQIGTAIEHASLVWSIALSPNDDWIATGENNGKVTLQSIRDVLPASYLTVNWPFMHISDAIYKPWVQGDLTRVEQLLTEEIACTSNPFHHARALAYRAIVRTRSRHQLWFNNLTLVISHTRSPSSAPETTNLPYSYSTVPSVKGSRAKRILSR